MAVPNEGTTSLPKDANSRSFSGVWDGSNFYAPREASGDAVSQNGIPANGLMVFNGTTWDRARGGGAVDGASSEVGIPISNQIRWDGSAHAYLEYSAAALGDGQNGIRSALVATSAWNGLSYDRWRGNTQGTLLASAARTSSTVTATQTNYNSHGVMVFLNITNASTTGGLAVVFCAVDPVSAGSIFLTDFNPRFTTTGIYGFELSPGGSSAAPSNIASYLVKRVAGSLPRTWFIRVDAGDSSSYTYSLGYQLF